MNGTSLELEQLAGVERERLEIEVGDGRRVVLHLHAVQGEAILHLAAATMECEVEAALAKLLDGGRVPDVEAVRALAAPTTVEVPEIIDAPIDLATYDALLAQGAIA